MVVWKLSAGITLGVILGLGASIIQDGNPYMEVELAINKIPRLWHNHIKVTLYIYLTKSATVYNSGVHDQYKRLSYIAIQLARWCLPHRIHVKSGWRKDIVNVKKWTPCGFIQLVQGYGYQAIKIHIQIEHRFYLQIHFLAFKFDLTMLSCQNSAGLYLCQINNTENSLNCYRKWKYCGHLRPWMQTLGSNAANIEFINEYPHFCNLTYTSLEIKVATIFMKYETYDTMRPTGFTNYLVFSHSFISNVYQWLIILPIGENVYFNTLETNYFIGSINLYSGEAYYYLLFSKTSNGEKDKKILGLLTNYFSASVHYYSNERYQNPDNIVLFVLSYDSQPVTPKVISSNTTITINSTEAIFHSVYSIQFTDVDSFPNVSFTIRKFTGWHGGECLYGGYALIHHITLPQLSSKFLLGPFCSKSLSSTPFIGTSGPKHIILGVDHYDFIVYAFGSLFEIDIDLDIRCSKCEGIFEPLIMCTSGINLSNQSFQIDESLTAIRYVTHQNYGLVCSAMKHVQVGVERETTVFILEIFKVSKCIVFQSISLFSEGMQIYILKGSMNVEVTAYETGDAFWGSNSYRSLSASLFSTERRTISMIKKYVNISYNGVALINYKAEDHRCHLGFYISIHIENSAHTHTCLNVTKKKSPTSAQLQYHLYEIPNLCGQIYSVRHLLQIYKFNIPIRTDAAQNTYMYIVFNTMCALDVNLPEQNYLTVIADLGNAAHTVGVWKNTLRVNHYFMPLIFIYDNILGCKFHVKYNLQHFYIRAFVDVMPQIHGSVLQVKQYSSYIFSNRNAVNYEKNFHWQNFSHNMIFLVWRFAILHEVHRRRIME